MGKRTISVLPIEKVGVVEEREGGLLVVIVAPDGTELGLLFPEAAASELSGALIERSRQNLRPHDERIAAEVDRDFHVSNIEALSPEGEKCMLRLASEGGPTLTFHLGSRMMRRWRDMLTDQIVRHERRQRQ